MPFAGSTTKSAIADDNAPQLATSSFAESSSWFPPSIDSESDLRFQPVALVSAVVDHSEIETVAYDPFDEVAWAAPIEEGVFRAPTELTLPSPATQDAEGYAETARDWSPKPLADLGINISQPAGALPHNYAAQRPLDAWPCASFAASRCWPLMTYHWAATCFCHRPLYFEEINLERYGYGCCDCLQPAVSAAHFFGTVPILPYCMATNCPCQCDYTLGHYRPGDCAPWRTHCPLP